MKPKSELELSIVLPCLNEAETIKFCIDEAQSYLKINNVLGEIVIGDNGSTDGSQEIALQAGARVVEVPEKGYGAAISGGFRAARGKYLLMADSDASYDLANLSPFLLKLRDGNDFVMGNRFKGGIQRGAMPFKNRYFGNPVLSGIGRLLFPSECSDFHCGIRALTSDAFAKLNLQTSGMEFASEMVIKATLARMRIAEVAVVLRPDGRSRPPHLRPWRDGWRHLRFMLIFSPRWLFLYPGLFLILTCATALALIERAPVKLPLGVQLVQFDVNTMVFCAAGLIIGSQSLLFSLLARTYAVEAKILPVSKSSKLISRFFTLESGLIVGILFLAVGVAGSLLAFSTWSDLKFGQLDARSMLRLVVPSITSLLLGSNLILTSFLLGILTTPSIKGKPQ